MTKYSTNHNHREFNGHRFWRACLLCRALARIFTGIAADYVIAHSGCRSVARKIRGAVMPDKIQQSSAPVFRPGVTGNYGNLRAHAPCPLLTSGADSASRNICGVSVRKRDDHRRRRRMDLRDVASATDRPEVSRGALAAIAEGAATRTAAPGRFAGNDRDHRPGCLRPIGSEYYLNWLPQPRRFAYALR